MAILFAKNTRFDDLRNRLQKIKVKKASMCIALFLATTIGLHAQEVHTEDDGHDHTQQQVTKSQIDSILRVNITPKEHADKLGRLGVSMQGCKQRDAFVFQQCLKNEIPVAVSMGGGYSKQIAHIVNAHSNTFRLAQQLFF